MYMYNSNDNKTILDFYKPLGVPVLKSKNLLFIKKKCI